MRWKIVNTGLAGLIGLAACGSSSGIYRPAETSAGTVGTSGGETASDSTSGASAGLTGGGTGGTGGGTTGGDTSGKQLGVTLHGDLAFPVLFAGEFYGALPDGGPDLSNLDCRISDGTDLGLLCSPAELPDGGLAGVIASRQILDIYVTSFSADALSQGTAAVSAEYGGNQGDGGEFATIELTVCSDAGGWGFERASFGQVSYQATSAGMFGEFQAHFLGYADGGGALRGTFGAGYCGALNGY